VIILCRPPRGTPAFNSIKIANHHTEPVLILSNSSAVCLIARSLANPNLQPFPIKSFNRTKKAKETFLRDGAQNQKIEKVCNFLYRPMEICAPS
jgi:hypothetical protein